MAELVSVTQQIDLSGVEPEQERDPTDVEHECFDQPVHRSLLTAIALRATAVGEGVSPTWRPVEIPLGDGRILVLDDS